MELLQQNKAIFYHPCNDSTEYLKTQDWDETTPTYAAGKVSDALWPTVGGPTFGAEAEFLGAGAKPQDISVAALSATKFVVAYRVQFASSARARVGTVSGTDITFGAEVEFFGMSSSDCISVTALLATKFVVAYRDQAGSNHGTAKVGTVNGTAITFGAETEFTTGTTSYISATTLSATAFVVAYRDDADSRHGTAKVGTVSGTAVTFGAEVEFLSADGADYISAAALSATAFVVAYRDNADSAHGTARVGTVSGTAITFGVEAEFNGATTAYISAAALSATAFVVAYQDGAAHGTARVGTVSGTDITFGVESEFLNAGAYDIFAAGLSATKFVAAYRDNPDSNRGKAKVGTVTGTAIAFGAEGEYATAWAGYNPVAALDSAILPPASATELVVAYRDGANSYQGTAKVGTLPAAPASSLAASTPGAYDSATAATKVAFCGWFRKPSA